MLRLLAFIGLVAAVSATGSLVGSSKCTWGPSYWCSAANAATECGALSYCQAQGLLLDVTVESAAPSPGECKICKIVVGAVAEKVGSNATEQEVEKVLDSICSKLGGFKGPCEAFVTKYTPELVALLVNDLNATSVCQKLGLCPKADGTYSKSSPVECKLCQLVIGKVVANLTSNSTEAEIEAELEKVCSKLGGLAAVCTDLIEKYTPELIAILASDLNATSVCQKIGLCPNSTTLAAPAPAPVEADASPVECKLCQLVIGKVVANLTSNSTEAEIEAELEKVCSKLGGLAGVCTDLIEKYTPELIAILASDLNATSVCQKIGLCPNSTTIATELLVADSASPVECKLCQLVIGKVVANLTSNSTEAEIEAELEKVCSKLGGLAAVCTDLIEKYTPELIAILASDLNATSVCQKIGLCPNSTSVLAKIASPIVEPVAAPKPGECKLCQLVISQIDTKLDSNSSIEEVEAALDKVCAKLGAFAKICDDLVTKYAPELVATLVSDLNATRVCAKIGLCPKSLAAPAPAPVDFVPVAVADTLNFAGALGTQDCTQGPSYWCSSKAAATKCNAIEHCESTVWAQFGSPQ